MSTEEIVSRAFEVFRTDVGSPPPRVLANAAPLKYNAMKIEMARGLLASGLVQLSAPA